jgi:hypothetical protein
MPRLTALKMNPNGIQIHQPKVAPQAFGATLGNRPHKFASHRLALQSRVL